MDDQRIGGFASDARYNSPWIASTVILGSTLVGAMAMVKGKDQRSAKNGSDPNEASARTIAAIQTTIEISNAQCTRLAKEVESLIAERKGLLAELSEIKDKQQADATLHATADGELLATRKRISQVDAELQSIRNNKHSMEMAKRSLQDELAACQRDKATLVEQNKGLEGDRKKAEEISDRTRQDNESLQAQLEVLRGKEQDNAKIKEAAKAATDEAAKKVEELKTQLDVSESSKKTQKQEHDEALQKVSQQGSKLKKDLQASEERLKTAEDTKSSLTQSLSKSEASKKHLEGQLQDANSLLAQSRTDLEITKQGLEEEKQQSKNLQSQLDKAESKEMGLKDDKQKLQAAKVALDSELASMREELEQQTSTSLKQNERVNRLNQELQKHTTENDRLKQESNNLKTARDSLTKDISELKARVKESQDELEVEKRRADEVIQKNETWNAEISKANDEVKDQRQRALEAHKRIEELEDEIKKYKSAAMTPQRPSSNPMVETTAPLPNIEANATAGTSEEISTEPNVPAPDSALHKDIPTPMPDSVDSPPSMEVGMPAETDEQPFVESTSLAVGSLLTTQDSEGAIEMSQEDDEGAPMGMTPAFGISMEKLGEMALEIEYETSSSYIEDEVAVEAVMGQTSSDDESIVGHRSPVDETEDLPDSISHPSEEITVAAETPDEISADPADEVSSLLPSSDRDPTEDAGMTEEDPDMNEVVDLALGFLNEDSDDEYLEEEIPEEEIPAQNDAGMTEDPDMNEVVDLALGFLNEDSDDEYLEEEIPEEDIPAQNDAVDTANPILDEPVSSVNPETDISVTQMMNQTKSPSEGILDLVDSTNTFQRAEENPNTDEPTFSATKDADSGVVDQQPEVITQSIPDNDGQEAPPAGESISKPKKEDQGEEAAQSESRLDVVPENNEQMVDARFPNNETGNTHYSAEDALVSPTVAAQRSLEYRANKNLYNLCVNCHFPLLKSSPGAMRIHRERCNRDSTFKLECKALYKPSPPKEPSAMRTIITPVSQRGRGHRQWPPSPPTSSVPRPPPPQSVLKVPNSGFTPLQNVGESFHFFPQGIRNDSASSVPPTRFGPLPAPSSPSTSSVNANPPATQAFGIGPTSPNAFQFRPTVESSVQSTPNDQQKTVRKKLTPLKILKAKLASLEKDLEAENEVLILEFTGHGPDDPARELQEDTISKLQAEIDELREQIKAAQGSKGGEGPPT